MIARYLIFVLLLAQLSTSDRAAVERYRSAIKSAESGASARAVEAAFAAIGPVDKALTQKLESLSDEEFKRLQQELPGLLVNREEIVFIKPDVAYFTKLAAARGDDADRAFFAALKATYPESVWPTYVEQQTDYAGCTRFGSMSLVETYRVWSEFQRKYPDRYPAPASEEASAVLGELTGSTCACGDRAAIERELDQFLRTFLASSARARIEERLQDLRGGRSNVRTQCIGG
jgi:hypothetical protein